MEALEDRVLFDGVPDAAMITPVDTTAGELPPAVTQPLQWADADFSQELILVDDGVENREALMASIIEGNPNAGLEIRFLESTFNGIDQISQILNESDQKYEAIHLLSHGSDGQIQLGDTVLNDSNISLYADQISNWSESLSADADLLIYGCNLAATTQGQQFVQSMAAVAGADVAASDDLTGHQSLGGDWELEYSSGQIETDVAITREAQIEFVGVLNTVSGTVFADANNDGTNNGETGIDGVTVTALDSTGAVVATAVTSGGGSYLLSNPSNGALRIEFNDFPAGYGISTADGAADPNTVSSVAFIDANAGNVTANLGLRVVDNVSYPELEIGNRVWLDANKDGVQDAGEQGLLAVTVSLYDVSNPNNPVSVGSTSTNADGQYYFNDSNVSYPDGSVGLKPLTDYEVRLGASNFGLLSPLDGLSVTLQDQEATLVASTTQAVTGTAGVPQQIDVLAINNLEADGRKVLLSNVTGGTATVDSDGSVTFVLGAGSTSGSFDYEIFEDRLDNDAIDSDTDGNGADDLAVIAFTTKASGSTDHSLDFGVADIEVDRGDLPDFYNTSIAQLRPAHIIDGSTYLGSSVDADSVAFPSSDGLGDDESAADDEDGVTFDTPLQAGHRAQISVVASTDGYLNAWMDFQSAGALGEISVTHVNGTALPSPTDINDFALTAGTTQLIIDVPADARGEMAARFRFTAEPMGSSRSTIGTAGSGEVEDYVLAAIGNYTFNDLDADGIQDFSDTALAGVVINLLDNTGSPVLDAVGNPITTTSDSFGRYEFQGLIDGQYQIEFVAPSGLQLTTQNVTIDANDSDPNPATGITNTYTISAGVTNNTVDAGFIPASAAAASLGDYVFFDADGDGVFSSGDTAVPGVVVNLLDGAGNPVLDGSGNPVTTTTNASGAYQFTGLTAGGSYQVQFVAPAGQDFTTQDVGSDDTIDSDVDPATGLSQVVTLGAGENNSTVDAGLIDEPVVVLPASLGDYVFFDTDGDGVFSSGDTAVPGVVVNLLDGAGNPVLDGSSNPITTTTNASGAYQFTGLTAGGSYQVQFVAPIGQDFTTQDVGGDDTIDSDVDPATGLSQVVTLASGENNSTVDAGLIDEPIVPPLLGSIGNLVFEDLNNNGIRDAGDPGEPGVTIELLDGSGNPIVDSSGNPITTITDAAGIYEFTDLPAGDYRIRSSLPGGHFFTQQFTGSDTAIDSNVDGAGLSSFVTLGAGEHNPTVDVGISHFASLSSTIFFDANGDGVQDTGDAGVANVVVNLIDSSGNQISTTTDSNGNYFFGDLRPGDFQIEVIAPAGMDFTLQHAAGDSAVDPTTGLSQVVTLASEENNTTLAAGLIDEPVDPPVVDPPVVDPPVIDPPVIDPPVVDPSTTSGSPANLPAPILLPLASQRFISAFVGSPNQNFSGFSIASNAHPLTLQTSRAVTGGYSSGFAIAGDYGAMTDQTYVDQGWIVEDQTYQSPYYYDAGEFIYGEDVAYGDMSQDGMFELELIVVDGADAWEAVVGQETVEFVMPPESAIVPPINNCNIRMPFLKRIHNWLHR